MNGYIPLLDEFTPQLELTCEGYRNGKVEDGGSLGELGSGMEDRPVYSQPLRGAAI